MTILRRFLASVLLATLMVMPAKAGQSTLVTPSSPLTMAGLASFLNNAYLAVASNYSGATPPAVCTGAAPCTYQYWLDTSTTPRTLRIYDGVQWVAIGTLDTSGHGFAVPISQPINPQTGTTYTYANSDCGKLVTRTNGSAISDILPQAGTASAFGAGCYLDVANNGAGTVTITPTTSTIGGGTSYTLLTNQSVRIVSDGTNYQVTRGIGGSYSGVSSITCGTGLTGGTITTTGSCVVDQNLALLSPTATTQSIGDNSTKVATDAFVTTAISKLDGLIYSATTYSFISRLATNPTTARKIAYNTLINSLVSTGVWAKLDALYLFAAEDSATALTNLVGSSYGATAVNAPAFTANTGFVGGSTKSINSNFNASAATTPNFVQDSASVFAWGDQVNANGGYLSGYAVSDHIQLVNRYSNNSRYVVVNASGGVSQASITDGSGLILGTRTGSTLTTAYVNGTSVSTGSAASSSVVNENIQFLSGSGVYYTGNIYAAGIGGGMTAQNAADLYAAVHVYLQTVAGLP